MYLGQLDGFTYEYSQKDEISGCYIKIFPNWKFSCHHWYIHNNELNLAIDMFQDEFSFNISNLNPQEIQEEEYGLIYMSFPPNRSERCEGVFHISFPLRNGNVFFLYIHEKTSKCFIDAFIKERDLEYLSQFSFLPYDEYFMGNIKILENPNFLFN